MVASSSIDLDRVNTFINFLYPGDSDNGKLSNLSFSAFSSGVINALTTLFTEAITISTAICTNKNKTNNIKTEGYSIKAGLSPESTKYSTNPKNIAKRSGTLT